MRVGIVQIERDSLSQNFLCFRQPTSLMQQHSERIHRLDVVALRRQRRTKFQFRLVMLAGFMKKLPKRAERFRVVRRRRDGRSSGGNRSVEVTFQR